MQEEKANVEQMRQSGEVGSSGGAAPEAAAPGGGGFVMQQCNQ